MHKSSHAKNSFIRVTRGRPFFFRSLSLFFPFFLSLFLFFLPWKIDRSPESIDLHRVSSLDEARTPNTRGRGAMSSRWPLRYSLFRSRSYQLFNFHSSPSLHLSFSSQEFPPHDTFQSWLYTYFIDRSLKGGGYFLFLGRGERLTVCARMVTLRHCSNQFERQKYLINYKNIKLI